MKVKKLSEYEALEGLTVMGKLSRTISPFAKNKKLMDKLRTCLAEWEKDHSKLGEAMFIVDIVELISNDAPELLLDILAIMSGEDKKKVGKSNLLEVVEALMELREDEQLANFLSRLFSLEVKGQLSISTTTGDAV